MGLMAMDRTSKNDLFETMKPARALTVMAVPTIASQLIVLVYNLADTWFIGRTNNPYMIGASSLVLTLYLAAVALANVFGVGGGSLMARLMGEKKMDEARRIASYSVAVAALAALVFSLLVLIFMDPLLRLLGASENTYSFGRQYLLAAVVVGGLPTVLSMCMPMLLRNTGYSKEAGLGVGLGGILNVLLDPLFMFVLLPKGNEVLGAAVATMLSNVVTLVYFIIMFRRVRDRTPLVLPRGIERIGSENARSLYSVGIPAAISIFLFDLVTIVINRLVVAYGDIPLAAMGIVLKLERIPVNIGLGVCLGMVPLVAFNFAAGNLARMKRFTDLARLAILGFSCACVVLFWLFARSIVVVFIKDEETVRLGAQFLRGRCFALPFMMIGYHTVNFMNAVGKGKVSFLQSLIRHLVLIIPLLLIMNRFFGLDGLIWAQVVADVVNAGIAIVFYRNVMKETVER